MPIEDRELVPIAVVDEMKQAYMDYAMSVIVSRALPDARDGFKPVHRRILYTMREENLTPDRPFKKSASTVGNVLARYHPHGDTAVYDSMVRMAQNFNMRYPLVQGHGNFGSIDGDNAAAMRYTEARLARIAMMMLEDLDKDTVDWRPNFDASLLEPSVLPSRLPNLLLNGTDGIAVGMATKIPPHNLGELISGVLALLDNAETSVEDLIELIPGPDFPTGAKILGVSGIREAYRSGRGSVMMRANIEVEDLGRDRHSLIVTAIPFQVNKTRLLERIGDGIRDKRIEGVSAFRDESDRNGMRIVLELSSNTHPEVVMNQLYKHSELQTSFGVNMLALVDGVPKVLNLRELLLVFIKHRRDVVRRRSQYLLDKALKRAHILEGLLKALDHIDQIIKLIRGSADPDSARSGLMIQFEFSDVQAQAILDMRLQRLTGLERDRLESELREVMANIEYLRGLLEDPAKLDTVVRDELVEVKTLFSDPRRTEIIAGAGGDLNIEDLIADEKMVVTISHSGYIKRVPFDTYRTQKRGGRGVSGTDLKDEDFLEHLFVSNTHEYLLFFTNTARVFKKKVHEILEFSRTARGSALVNLLNFGPGEKVAAVIPVRKFDQGGAVVTCTKSGIVKRTELDLYSNISAGGIIALNLRDGDELVSVKLSPGHEDLIIVTRHGQAVRFNVTDVRSMGRTATGVKGVTLREGDHVIAMETTDSGSELLVVTESGYGKRTPLDQYPVINRGGVGVKTIQMTDRNGSIMGALVVNEEHELMVSTMQGTVIKMAVKDISVFGRATQGVRVIRLGEGDTVGAVTRIIPEDESVEEIDESEEDAIDEQDSSDSDTENSDSE
jgi:DNA gyrase subunit A